MYKVEFNITLLMSLCYNLYQKAIVMTNNISSSINLTNLPIDSLLHVLSFVEDKDLLALDAVSHMFRSLVKDRCEEIARDEKFFPEKLPENTTLTQFVLNRFPQAIKPDFFQRHFGEVDEGIPVPANFIIRNPSLDYKLVFIPKLIRVKVDENSLLMLDESTAIDGKQARLVESPDAPQGAPREIEVPVTLNNLFLLARRHLKNAPPLPFEGPSDLSWPNVLAQNGDIGAGPSHWSYQRKGLIGRCMPYHSVQNGALGKIELALEQGLEIVPLLDRILFHLSSCIQSGTMPQSLNAECTSTVTRTNNNRPKQSTIRFKLDDPPILLLDRFEYCCDGFCVGAAVQIPAKKPILQVVSV